jgi:hypothetical protein
LPGVIVRPRSAVVWIIARRPYTINGPILWNTRYVPAQKQVLTPGSPPVPETIEYAEPETGPPPPTPVGQWDTVRLTWFELIDRWSAEIIVGNLAEQGSLDPRAPDQTPSDDDQGRPDPDGPGNNYTGTGDPYNPGDVARPPGAGAPDDEYIDEDGNRRLRSSGRLFLLTSTSLYLLSGDGGRTWSRYNGPWGAGAAASVLGGVVHVVDAAGNLWVSENGAMSWTRAPRGVQLAQTAAGGGNQLAVGRAGRIVIDGGAAREGDTPLGNRSLTSLAYRRPSRGGADAWEIADEKRGSLNGARRGIVVNRIEETATGVQYWVGPRAANPTVAAGTYRIVFDRTNWLDASNSVWKPSWPNQFLTDSIAWPGGSALDYANAVINALNPRARLNLGGPDLPVPVDISASAEWVEYPDNTRRAKLTIIWQPRPPQPGEYPKEFRPYDRLRLDGAMHPSITGAGPLTAVSGAGMDADWNPALTTIRYEGNVAAAAQESAPNSDSFALLKIEAVGGDINALANAAGGTLNGTIAVTAIHDTTFGWTASGPRPPSQDMTRSVIDIEVVIGNNWRYRGGLGGDGLPESQRPFDGERVRAGGIEVQLAFDAANSSPGFGGAQPENVSLSVFFPSGWRFPIDIQQIPSARPWRGMRSECSASTTQVPIVYRPAREGGWTIVASDRAAAQASVSGQTISFSALPPIPAQTDAVVSTRFDTVAVGSSGHFGALKIDLSGWNPTASVADLPPSFQINPPVTWGSGRDRLLVVSRDGGPRARLVNPSGSSTLLAFSGALVGRRCTSLNYRAGRWWAVDGGTNRLYWSNDGATWRVLPPLGNDVQAIEVEGE